MTTKTQHVVTAATNTAVQTILERYNSEYEKVFADALRNLKRGVKTAARNPEPRNPVRRSSESRRSHADVKVYDSEGRELERDMKVRTPDGGWGIVTRFNRSQGRIVVRREDDSLRMVTAHRVTIL